ncbi:MAG: hypothetical protein MUP68_16620 [Deltaproteobacteria bacterium]|nr:hypothetical protein [Deltaproteobacteria bacterium]
MKNFTRLFPYLVFGSIPMTQLHGSCPFRCGSDWNFFPRPPFLRVYGRLGGKGKNGSPQKSLKGIGST